MADTAQLLRKWVPMAGGSCDVRMGVNALEQAAKVFAASVGKPRRCMAVVGADADADLCERLRRQLVDAGFEVSWHDVSTASVWDFSEVQRLMVAFAEAHITSDDLCCAMGGAGLLSVASLASDLWCGGVSLAAVPLDTVAFLEGALIPGALTAGAAQGRVAVRSTAKHVLLDLDLVSVPQESEVARRTRALMAAAAMTGSERAFSALWDRVDQIMADEPGAFSTQLLETAKSRGQVASSTAAAVRQSLVYGRDFAYAAGSLAGEGTSYAALLGEGMRFLARIAVAMGKFPMDDMLAQDELLDALQVGTVRCDVDPAQLVEALKAQRFATTNRFLVPIPYAIGRVRLVSVDDALLAEHAAAWCAAHR